MRNKKIAIISAVVVLLAAALCYGLCFKALDGDSAKAGSESGEVTTPTPASIANPSDKEIEIEAPGEKVRYEMVDSHLHYLDELKEALAYNRNCNIIWAHVGISRRVEVQHLIDIADDLLAENPNLYIDISWVVYDYCV